MMHVITREVVAWAVVSRADEELLTVYLHEASAASYARAIDGTVRPLGFLP